MDPEKKKRDLMVQDSYSFAPIARREQLIEMLLEKTLWKKGPDQDFCICLNIM